MRRFLTLVCLLCLAIPAGISISGCTRNPDANYCYGNTGGLKITSVAKITLQPQTTGMTMAFGQTMQVNNPSATTCNGATASVASYSYGTTNNQLVDISPSGGICAGTWNRNTGGGIGDYTICSVPNPLPSTGSLPYGVAYITATASSVTSNPVAVYVHAPVTSVSLVGPTQCISQNNTAQLDAQACYTSGGINYELCAPASITSSSSPSLACQLPYLNGVSGARMPVTSIPACTSSIGSLSFTPGTPSVGKIDNLTNVITALNPGTTAITASLSGSGSSAGYFSTCPPASIKVALANEETSGTVTQGATQNLVTTITDTTGATITGLSLDYQSTDPQDISVSSTGAITASFPGVASIYAVCQPASCNPSPINVFGQNGTGLSLTSNSVTITTPGTASQYVWYGAPGQSQYFVPVELLMGTVGSAVRLPYVPNSMVMDKTGTNLFFGSEHELMTYSAVANSLTSLNTNVPGVVLAVSPNDQQLLINDQILDKFYIYTVSSGASTIFGGLSSGQGGGLGITAAWTPDSKTLYIADSAAVNCAATNITGHTDTLYIYNVNTSWHTYQLPSSGGVTCKSTPSGIQDLAITIPSVGAYIGGNPTVAHTWCPTGTIVTVPGSAPVSTITAFYPQVDSVAAQTDVLAATTDGEHILGAAVTDSGVTLTDIGLQIPTSLTTPTAECPVTTSTNPITGVVTQTLGALSTNPTLNASLAVTVNSTAANTVVNQVVTSPKSSLAFLTYTNNGTTTGDALPYYVPGSGTVSYLPLTDSATPTITAPVAGAFAPDDSYFFVSTAGDNQIHYISVPLVTTNPASADTKQISPNLPACTPVADGGVDPGCTYSGSGTIVPATVMAVRPRSTT